MAEDKQLALVNLRKIEKAANVRKPPEPRNILEPLIKKFEILHHPFDLNFRGRIHSWLNLLEKSKDFNVKNIKSAKSKKLINYYFYPQKGKWITQEELSKKIKGLKKRHIRGELVSLLLGIWNSHKS